MAAYSMITTSGVNNINSANSNGGPYVEIAYYVPIYDYRIDESAGALNASISAQNVFSVTSNSDVFPSGEILWNIPSDKKYELSETNKYAISGSGTTYTSSQITNAKSSYPIKVNTIGGVVVGANYLSGTTLNNNTSGYNWTGTNISTTPSYNFGISDISNIGVGNFYTGVTYSPVVTSAGKKRAQFSVDITPNGTIKFNKIALYAVNRENNVLTHKPFLFAQVILPSTQTVNGDVSNVSGEIGGLSLVFQIESSNVSNNFESVVYGTSADYWTQTSFDVDGPPVYGLYYPGSVYIANNISYSDQNFYYNSATDANASKLFVSTFEKLNLLSAGGVYYTEKETPQLCLQYVTSANKRLRTTFRTNVDGNCSVDFYGMCTSAETRFALIPETTQTFDLGSGDNRWLTLWGNALNLESKQTRYGNMSYFRVTPNGGTFQTDLDMLLSDHSYLTKYRGGVYTSTINRFFFGNIKSRNNEDLFIRTSDKKNIFITSDVSEYVQNSVIYSTIDKDFSTTFTNYKSNGNVVIHGGAIGLYGDVILSKGLYFKDATNVKIGSIVAPLSAINVSTMYTNSIGISRNAPTGSGRAYGSAVANFGINVLNNLLPKDGTIRLGNDSKRFNLFAGSIDSEIIKVPQGDVGKAVEDVSTLNTNMTAILSTIESLGVDVGSFSAQNWHRLVYYSYNTQTHVLQPLTNVTSKILYVSTSIPKSNNYILRVMGNDGAENRSYLTDTSVAKNCDVFYNKPANTIKISITVNTKNTGNDTTIFRINSKKLHRCLGFDYGDVAWDIYNPDMEKIEITNTVTKNVESFLNPITTYYHDGTSETSISRNLTDIGDGSDIIIDIYLKMPPATSRLCDLNGHDIRDGRFGDYSMLVEWAGDIPTEFKFKKTGSTSYDTAARSGLESTFGMGAWYFGEFDSNAANRLINDNDSVSGIAAFKNIIAGF